MTEQQLADEQAIRHLVATYSDAVNRADESAWKATWAEDGRWTVASAVEGREEIVGFWRTLMGRFEWVSQLPQFGLIEVGAEGAVGRWWVIELGRTREGEGSFTFACYEDEYVRFEAGWLFQSRHFHMLYTGPPDLSGSHFPLAGCRELNSG